VCSLRELLRAFLDHRRDVLLRRSRHRLGKIEARLHLLEGYIIAFLNLDRVIEIIRTEDEPKPVMMAEFKLDDIQAEAILNMRLRSLRRLEEMALRRERDGLMTEKADLEALLADESAQWARIREQIAEIDAKFGRSAKGGARRTTIEAAPDIEDMPLEAMIEREPITVICSQNGWIRAIKGRQPLDAEVKFKDGDGPRFAFHAETTDKLLLLASSGRVFTLGADKLPGGRGMGEPLRLMIDMDQADGIVTLFRHQPGAKRLIASTAGDGFLVAEAEMLAQTRAGRQVLNVKAPVKAALCIPAEGDAVAVVGENRKFLVFPLEELPEMGRGKGVRLQKYKDGGLSDTRVFSMADGISWTMTGGRTRTVQGAELAEYVGKRATAGRMAPRGFPRDQKFA
jgi:topoisomerase-4 subunit A